MANNKTEAMLLVTWLHHISTLSKGGCYHGTPKTSAIWHQSQIMRPMSWKFIRDHLHALIKSMFQGMQGEEMSEQRETDTEMDNRAAGHKQLCHMKGMCATWDKKFSWTEGAERVCEHQVKGAGGPAVRHTVKRDMCVSVCVCENLSHGWWKWSGV